MKLPAASCRVSGDGEQTEHSGEEAKNGTMNKLNPCIKRVIRFFMGTQVIIFCIMILGCGYQFRTNGIPVGIELRSLAIPMMPSTSSHLGFEADFTRNIREEFISYGRVPLVSEEDAQMVLVGKVYDIKTEPLTFRRQQQTVEGNLITHETTSGRRLKVYLDVKLLERATGRVIWHEKNIEEKSFYRVDEDPLVTRHNERQAVETISQLLAKRVFLRTMERF
jgi:hypothetical protein